MTGRLIAVVGPSGVGKDSLINALAARRPDWRIVRRVITRQADLGGEDFMPVSESEFATMNDAGAFCLSWQAHGLSYGVPTETSAAVAAGQVLIVNLSRNVLPRALALFPSLTVLNVTARAETLAARLTARNRETEADIAARLARADAGIAPGIAVVTVNNDGPLDDTVDQALAALFPVRA